GDALVDLNVYPDRISGKQIEEQLKNLSPVPSSPRFAADGRQLDDKDYGRYLDNCGFDRIPDEVAVRWGLAVKRGLLRSFPTADRVTNANRDKEIDMFVETALYPGEPVAVLHESRDGKWLLVRKYNYLAWADASQIAVGRRDEVLGYASGKPFLVVTGAKEKTVYNPDAPEISELEFDMGCRLPLVADPPEEIGGMGVDYCFAVAVPTRNADGTLTVHPTLIRRSADVSLGYLPYTKGNIVRQAFKFLGERYGWGDDNNARDCSGFVLNVYTSMGLVMPRNGGEQELASEGIHVDLSGKTPEERVTLLRAMETGDTISSPTHIMLFLAGYDGELWMIHDHIGSNYIGKDGEWIDVSTRGVGVSPILGYMTGRNRHYYEDFSGLKRFVLTKKGN
ncbi:MAG: SH3 domain-containing protein, partial [Victivallaceae bacterium]|nr:SH3 domain-containing protein [Victivallaceae bacterium]